MLTLEKTALTYKDYAQLSEGAPYQLINGALIMSPAPSLYHQRISMHLASELHYFVKQHDLGFVFHAPVDVYLTETDTFQPDIVFISKVRSRILTEQKIEGAPDLTIEILSPSTAYYDLKYKKQMYEKYGVKEYWIVDPLELSIEIYENVAGTFALHQRVQEKGKVHSALLQNFEIDLQTIF